MDEKKPNKDCNHQWKQTGFWDGEDKNHQPVNGPIAKCSNCDGVSRFTWKEWQALPKKIRTELK